ncbi:MAG TPA: glycosyltransferase family 9 protein [Thermodesulfovibrionales bacterium]|nr:glycosyltransferase family 9 protein [Thermodesulfovibrionales bacterium]
MRISPADGLLFLVMRLLKSLDKRKRDVKYFDPSSVNRILVVSSTAIGDTLLSTPAIKTVRERYPHADIVAHFNIKNMELFDNNPHINGIIPYYGGYKKFFGTVSKFRKHKFDLALIFHGNEPQASPTAYLSGIRFIMKLPNNGEYRFLLSNTEPVMSWLDFGHAIEQRLKVAELAGCVASGLPRMELPLRGEGENAVDAFLDGSNITPSDRLVGFQVGASTLSRMWFADRFIELGRRLIHELGDIQIVITGSPQEYGYCKKIADAIGTKAFVSAGKIPLRYVPSLVRRLRVLVTGDTGIMHMAIATGTPIVALFAVSDSQRSGPYYDKEKHRVIQKEKTCDPCTSKKCTYQRCMENISVEEVFCELMEVIER